MNDPIDQCPPNFCDLRHTFKSIEFFHIKLLKNLDSQPFWKHVRKNRSFSGYLEFLATASVSKSYFGQNSDERMSP